MPPVRRRAWRRCRCCASLLPSAASRPRSCLVPRHNQPAAPLLPINRPGFKPCATTLASGAPFRACIPQDNCCRAGADPSAPCPPPVSGPACAAAQARCNGACIDPATQCCKADSTRGKQCAAPEECPADGGTCGELQQLACMGVGKNGMAAPALFSRALCWWLAHQAWHPPPLHCLPQAASTPPTCPAGHPASILPPSAADPRRQWGGSASYRKCARATAARAVRTHRRKRRRGRQASTPPLPHAHPPASPMPQPAPAPPTSPAGHPASTPPPSAARRPQAWACSAPHQSGAPPTAGPAVNCHAASTAAQQTRGWPCRCGWAAAAASRHRHRPALSSLAAGCPDSGEVRCGGVCINPTIQCCATDSSVGARCSAPEACPADGGTCGELLRCQQSGCTTELRLGWPALQSSFCRQRSRALCCPVAVATCRSLPHTRRRALRQHVHRPRHPVLHNGSRRRRAERSAARLLRGRRRHPC